MTNHATRQFQNLMQGVRLTLPQARALRDDPPANLSDRQKRKLIAWVDAQEAKTRRRQTERYKAVRELLSTRREELSEEIDALNEYVAEIKDKLSAGRITPEKAQEALTSSFKEIKKIRERIAGTREDDEQAWAMVNTDPADFEREQLTRLPHLAETLPHLTPADLNGGEA